MASGSTHIIYGGLRLFNVLTKHFNQENIRDDTDTDNIGVRFTYSCVAQVHGMPASLAGILPTTGDFDAANAMVGLRYLFQDRQHFELRMGVVLDILGNIVNPGTVMVRCDPANIAGSTNVNLRDINNGPKAKLMNVSHIRGDAALQVEVEFELSMLQCLPDGTTLNDGGVLNNRWTVVDEIDRNFMTTRTFTGKLRLSSSQVNPHSFRGVVVPPLQQGMRREHMQFAASEDGLALMYSVTDKEVAFAPPAPATSWSARFEEEIVIDGQLGFFSTADITLGGDRNCDKKRLIEIASGMAIAKFSNGILKPFGTDKNYFVQSISVVDEYAEDGSSAIHLRAVARRLDTRGPALLGLPSAFVGVPITGNTLSGIAGDYDYRNSRGARPGDSTETSGPISVVAAFSAFLQGPCQIDHGIGNALYPRQPPVQPGQSVTSVKAVISKNIPDDKTITTVYGSDNNDGMYTYWTSEQHDDVDANRAQCPVAATTPPGSSGSIIGDAWWDGTAPAAPQPSAVVINLTPPTMKRHVILDGERVGQPPAMPRASDHTDSAGVRWKVAKTSISRQAGSPTADGKYKHRVQLNIFYFATNVITGAVTGGWQKGVFLDPWKITPVTVIGTPEPGAKASITEKGYSFGDF